MSLESKKSPRLAIFILTWISLIVFISSIGPSSVGLLGPMLMIDTLIRPALIVSSFLLAALGFGRLIARSLKLPRAGIVFELALGLAFILELDLLLGITGVLFKPGIALLIIVLGVLALIVTSVQSLRESIELPDVPLIAWACLPASAVLIVASSSLPGGLWQSEAFGYDTLSYHLQLPREWIALGRIVPLEHNVYSFLPGLMEVGWTHLALINGGMHNNQASAMNAAHLLHASFVFISAMLAARAVLMLTGVESEKSRKPGIWLAAGLVIATPWVVVVGSMAYNEMAVVAFGLAAMVCALLPDISCLKRGMLVGALVGSACSAKPTAMFLITPIVACVMLLGSTKPTKVRHGLTLLASAAFTGSAVLFVWLIRNWLVSGNPVFPAASGLFGTGHWTSEQIQRFIQAHQFQGSFISRLALLFSTTRGMFHSQWSLLWIFVLVLSSLGLTHANTRKATVILGLGLIMACAGWLIFTHLQSRFLVPLLIAAAPMAGLGLVGLMSHLRKPLHCRIASVAAAVLVATLSIHTFIIFHHQRNGDPNIRLVQGFDAITGKMFKDQIQTSDPVHRQELVDLLSPAGYVNVVLSNSASVYLLGDATPLYFQKPVIYHTTWDTSPLGQAIRSAPDDPARWAGLLSEQGLTHVLVNLAELDRLTSDNWYDPAATQASVQRFVQSLGKPTHSWPKLGRFLYELPSQ